MKKILLYSAVAIALGLSITLIPLITFATITAENHFLLSPAEFAPSVKSSYNAKMQGNATVDVTIFAVSFVIAIVAYAVSKRKMPREGHIWIKPY